LVVGGSVVGGAVVGVQDPEQTVRPANYNIVEKEK
jgi:hypothetical protein